MKKVGLCIVYQNCNYGSNLQSYATLLKLKELGFDYEIIRYRAKKDAAYAIKTAPRFFNYYFLRARVKGGQKKLAKIKHAS